MSTTEADTATGTVAPRRRLGRRATALDIAVVGILAALTGLIHLGTKSLWSDEGYSAIEADTRGTHNFILAWYHGDPNGTLYYLLLHVWSYLGTSEIELRSLSVLFAAAGAAMTYVLGRELFGRAEGLTAGALVAVNSFAVTYAQTARGYSLLLLLAVTSTLLFLRTLHDDRRRYWIGYAVLTAAGCYVHYFMAMVVATQIIFFALTRRHGTGLRSALRCWGLAAVLVVPIAVHAAHVGKSQIAWISATTPTGVATLGRNLAGGRGTAVLSVAALVVTAIIAVRRSATEEGRAALLVVLGVAVPIIGGLVASATVTPLLVDRYYIECVPMIALALSVTVWQLPRLSVSLAALAVVLGLSVASTVVWYRQPPLQDWRGATRYLASQQWPQLQVLDTIAPGEALRYYLERDSASLNAGFDDMPVRCQSLAAPSCLGASDQVVVITPPQGDDLGTADVQAIRRAGYTADPPRMFSGLVLTHYSRGPV